MKKFLIATAILVITNSAGAYQLTDLEANVAPNAINNFGIIVGSSNTDQYPPKALSWTAEGGFELIDGTSANAINDDGLIAGTTLTGAFITNGSKYQEWIDYNAFGMNQMTGQPMVGC